MVVGGCYLPTGGRFDCKVRTTAAVAAFVDGFVAASKAEQQCGDKTRVEFANTEIDDGFVSFFSQGEGAFGVCCCVRTNQSNVRARLTAHCTRLS